MTPAAENLFFAGPAVLAGWIFGCLLVRDMNDGGPPSPRAFAYSFLGVFVPALIALALTLRSNNAGAFLAQFSPTTLSFSHLALAVGLPAAVVLFGHIVGPCLHRAPIPIPPQGIIWQMRLYIFIFVVWGFLEEVGWRGFLAHRLQSTWSPAVAGLASGFAWTLWHLPQMLFSKQLRGSMKNFVTLGTILWGLQCVSLGVLLAWLQFHSGTLLIPAMAHALINILGNISDAGFGDSKHPLWDGPSGAPALVASVGLNIALYSS